MQDFKKKQYLYLMLAVFGAISLSIAFFFILYRLSGIGEMLDSLSQILAPFIYGGVVAYLLRPMCNTFEEYLRVRLKPKYKKYSDTLAMAGSFITVTLIIYALIAMIVPRVYDSLIKLGNSIPPRVDNLISWADSTFGDNERIGALLDTFNTSYATLYEEASNLISREIIPQITTFVSGLGSSVYKALHALYNLLVGIIVAVYFLHSRKKFAAQGKLVIHSVFKDKTAQMILDEISVVDRMFGGFIDAKILDSAIIGVLCYIGCTILRIPNALLISVFIGVTNIIPFFGPFIGAVPSTLLILIEEPVKAIWFLVFIIVLQQLDGNIIGPRIMGNRIGISGFWVMFAIIFFGGTMGLFGMVIGVPLFAVIYDLVRKFIKRGLSRKDKSKMWDEYSEKYPNVDEAANTKSIQELTTLDWKTELLQLFIRAKADLKTVYKWTKVLFSKIVICVSFVVRKLVVCGRFVIRKTVEFYTYCKNLIEKDNEKR